MKRVFAVFAAAAAFNRENSACRIQLRDYGEDGLTPVGEPTAEGGQSAFCPRGELAIIRQTEHPDACWQFLRSFLLDEAQDAAAGHWLPVQRAALKRRAENAASLYGEQTPSRETMEGLAALLDRQMYVSRYASDAADILAIVQEQAAAYFNGQDTAQAAAADIQSRMSQYLAEHN